MDFRPRADVDAACRFFQQQQLWVSCNGTGKEHLLLVATAKLAYRLLGALKAKANLFGQRPRPGHFGAFAAKNP